MKYAASAEGMPLRTQLGGQARLQHAICLDSLGQGQEAHSIYRSLSRHPTSHVAKRANQVFPSPLGLWQLECELKPSGTYGRRLQNGSPLHGDKLQLANSACKYKTLHAKYLSVPLVRHPRIGQATLYLYGPDPLWVRALMMSGGVNVYLWSVQNPLWQSGCTTANPLTGWRYQNAFHFSSALVPAPASLWLHAGFCTTKCKTLLSYMLTGVSGHFF